MKSATSVIVWIIIPGVHKRQYTRLVYLIIITISLLLVMMIIVTRCTSTASWSTSCKQRKAVTKLLLAVTCTRWEIAKTRQSKHCRFCIYIGRRGWSCLVFARKIVRMILTQNI